MSISWEKEEEQAIAATTLQQIQQQSSPSSSSYSFSDNPAIDRKVKAAVQGGLQGNVQRLFSKFPTDEDRELVADYPYMHAPGEYSHQNKEGLHLKPGLPIQVFWL